MATTITAFVNKESVGGDGTTNNTSGATAAYASLSACLTARAKNLVTADEILLVKCTGSAADTTAVAATVWASFVMDATRYVQIEPNTGQGHGGAWNTGVYRLETTDASALQLPTTAGVMYHIRLRGLQVRTIATTGSTNRRAVNAAGPGISVNSIVDVQGCILRVSKSGGTGTSHAGITIEDSNWNTFYLANTLILLDGTSVGNGVSRNMQGNTYVHNCGVVADGECYASNTVNGTFQIKNSWGKGGTTFAVNHDTSSDYNSTDLGTATGGANDRVSQTFTFVDAGNGDYRPASNDAAIRGHGVDLSADGDLAITTDMEGNSLNSPPDIGPLNAEVVLEESENRWRIRRAAA